jgi:hypothetical protein|tara:strand:+ start:341 stop:805 length:465 start_codon:yes stop_codon:yes gene_type:complete
MIVGLRNTWRQVLNANGPAQMISYGFWGVIVAGLFYGVDTSCYPNWLIITWGVVSASVIPFTIWGGKSLLKFTLLLDTVLSAYILTLFLMHVPHTTEFVYSISTLNGIKEASRGMSHTSVSEWFHAVALVWMSFHSIYLANLTQRQILEKKRFS